MSKQQKVQIELPPKLIPLFSESGVRYRSSWGGRGSAKTRSFALMTAIKGYIFAEAQTSGMILGAREFEKGKGVILAHLSRVVPEKLVVDSGQLVNAIAGLKTLGITAVRSA